ncbi:nucleotidyltransferase domain-containing protein [Candidatus Uhrbacteria bacterium]|nr:nucleotidyltransferase domain-containing protein [Candidatus Uhrbacteria bacterium]
MARKKISGVVKKHVQKYLASLDFPIEQAFIFGSQAKGRPRKYSDIDVAIISSKIRNSLASTKYLLRKAHDLHSANFYIEPHGFHPREFVDESPLAWEIKKTGVRLQ